MAENNPTVPSAVPVPPKAPEAAKVQPKKETVRIALPPKPSASPTIKLPSMPGGATSASAAAAPGAPMAATAHAAPAAPVVPARPVSSGAPPPPKPPASTGVAMAKPAGAKEGTKAPIVKKDKDKQPVGQVDLALAMVAALVGLAAVVSVLAMVFGPFALK